jgi:uncharacterized protein DUF4349
MGTARRQQRRLLPRPSDLRRPRRRGVPYARLLRLVTAAVLVAFLIAACSGGGSGDSTSSAGSASGAAAGKAASGPQKRAALTPPDGERSEPGSDTEARVVPLDRQIVYTASLSVRVKNVDRAVSAAEAVATGRGGLVFGEQSSTDPDTPDGQQSTLTLKVPAEAFRPALGQLAGLGTRVSQTQSARDVTSRVVDVRSRVQSQRDSVQRLRTLLGRAKTVGEVISVESELTQRQADLESLEAQQKTLASQTALATITLTLVGPGAVAAAPDNGFVAGLQRGWDAFVTAVVGLLTVLGAVLPFAIATALVLVPVAGILRRRRRASHPTDAEPAASS